MRVGQKIGRRMGRRKRKNPTTYAVSKAPEGPPMLHPCPVCGEHMRDTSDGRWRCRKFKCRKVLG